MINELAAPPEWSGAPDHARLSLGYTDAKYDRFDNLTGLAPGQIATDLEFDRVPKWTYYLGASYDTDLSDSVKLNLYLAQPCLYRLAQYAGA